MLSIKQILHHFFEVIDEEATFTIEFKKTWQTFMSECLQRMIKKMLDKEKWLIEITDLDHLTLNYDIYDAEGIFDLNDADFQVLLNKKLHNKRKEKQNKCGHM